MIDFKYAAGFVDADGSIQIHAKKFGDVFSIYPVVTISQLTRRSMLLHDVADFYKLSVHTNKNNASEIRVSGAKGTRFLEQLKKHLVLKQELAEYILSLPKQVGEPELKSIKKVIKNLRRNNTTPKKHPSRRWAAGYVDGDGSVTAVMYKNGQLECRLSISSWIHAQAGLKLMQKAFGGYIVEQKNTANWRVNLSPTKVQELDEFLGKHLMIKKTQMKLACDFIGKNKHSRRLGATDEDIRNFCETLATTKSMDLKNQDTIV